jgi:hypothetical protein
MAYERFEFTPIAQVYTEGRQQETFDQLAAVADDKDMQKQLRARDMGHVLVQFADARAAKYTLDQLEEQYQLPVPGTGWPTFEGESFNRRKRNVYENALVISQAGRAVGLVQRQRPDDDPERGGLLKSVSLDQEKLGLYISAWVSPKASTGPSAADTLAGVYSSVTSTQTKEGWWVDIPSWVITPNSVANDRERRELNWDSAMFRAGFRRYQEFKETGVPKPSKYNYKVNGVERTTKGVLYTYPEHQPGALQKA